jgi:hypothetical protein
MFLLRPRQAAALPAVAGYSYSPSIDKPVTALVDANRDL